MSRKIVIEDLNEGLSHLIQAALKGECVIPGCKGQAELMTSFPTDPPLYCCAHQENGSESHYGEYVPTNNPYYQKWTCCESNWFKATCYRVSEKVKMTTTIPVSEQQRMRLKAEQDRLAQQQEEWERYERMINAGREEAYDR